MRYPGLGLLAALAAVSIAACDSSDSSDDGGAVEMKTTDMSINASVKAADDVTAKVSVELYHMLPGPDIYYRLTGGDALAACVGAVCRPLTRGQRNAYEADLPYVAEAAYTISLNRQGDVSAPNSVVTMLVPLAILAPPSGLSVTDGQTVTVQWSPPNNGYADVGSSAHCFHQGGAQSDRNAVLAATFSDTGTTITNVDEMFAGWVVRPPLPQAPVLRCDIVLEVTQTRAGTVDDAFAGGGIGAVITRSVTLHYTPSRL